LIACAALHTSKRGRENEEERERGGERKRRRENEEERERGGERTRRRENEGEKLSDNWRELYR
jgi:hypothetical protein